MGLEKQNQLQETHKSIRLGCNGIIEMIRLLGLVLIVVGFGFFFKGMKSVNHCEVIGLPGVFLVSLGIAVLIFG